MMLISILRGAALITAALLIGVLPAVAQTSPIEASASPTSIGFEDPDDTSNLLEYRLPDWGYRIWDLAFDLGGHGSDFYGGDDSRQANNSFNTHLSTDYVRYRESESRTTNATVRASGSYNKSHQGSSIQTVKGHRLTGSLGLNGLRREYLGSGPFSLTAGGSLNTRYLEDIAEFNGESSSVEIRNFMRSDDFGLNLGAGVGRVRDVTPLIRAQRLSERLVALERPPLTDDQIRQVAEVLATEQGYRTVYERPDRSFWRDVLEPMLDEDDPLSPYEVFYLRDVLVEDVGTRSQGTRLSLGVAYQEIRDDNGDEDYLSIRRYAFSTLGWYHNLSLNRQVSAEGTVRLTRRSARDDRADYLAGSVNLAYLWTILDRYRWDTKLRFVSDYNEHTRFDDQVIAREYRTEVLSEFRIFIEDNLALKASVSGANLQDYDVAQINGGESERYRRTWRWAYGIGIEYRLDGLLY